MRPKTATAYIKDVPGPGAYDPKSSTFTGSPQWKVGSSRRDEKKKSVSPGPGMYDTRGKFQGPKWGFGSGSRNGKRDSDMPGPGAYEIRSTIPNPPPHVMMHVRT